VSPFIKFKNASKETIDASEELVEEIRRALIQAGQRLSRHIRREVKANDLEEKLRHIEQFCPILVDGLCRITNAPEARKKRAEDGLVKILGRDAREAQTELKEADAIVTAAIAKSNKNKKPDDDEGGDSDGSENGKQKKSKSGAREKAKPAAVRASSDDDDSDGGGQTSFNL